MRVSSVTPPNTHNPARPRHRRDVHRRGARRTAGVYLAAAYRKVARCHFRKPSPAMSHCCASRAVTHCDWDASTIGSRSPIRGVPAANVPANLLFVAASCKIADRHCHPSQLCHHGGKVPVCAGGALALLHPKTSISACVLMRSRPSKPVVPCTQRVLGLTRWTAAENFWIGQGGI